jgi:hypothetical protein
MVTSEKIFMMQLLQGLGGWAPTQNRASSNVKLLGLVAMEKYVTCACEKKEMRRKTAVKTGM